MEITAAQRTVCVFLHHLYGNCSYLQSTYRAFGRFLFQIGEKVGVAKESHSPTVRSDQERMRPEVMTTLCKPRSDKKQLFVCM